MKFPAIGFSTLCVLSFAASAAHAAQVNFSSTVTFASGPHSGLFTAGDFVSVSYELDTSVADTNLAGDAGFFPGATLNLSFEFPEPGLSINFSSGNVQTFDNTSIPDGQMFIFASVNQGSSLLGGEVIQAVELDFIGLTSMLPSDAIPNSLPNDITDPFAFFNTASGWTQVSFSADDLNVIPLPAAVWLFAGALVGLIGFKRKRTV